MVSILLLIHTKTNSSINEIAGAGRRKREIDSSLRNKEERNVTEAIESEELEPSLDRVFVPTKRAIYETRKQMLRATNKFNFRNMDMVKSFPYLFELLWYVI